MTTGVHRVTLLSTALTVLYLNSDAALLLISSALKIDEWDTLLKADEC